MGITRGEFLRSAAVGAGAALTGLAGLGLTEASAGDEGRGSVGRMLKRDEFAPHIGSTFRILDRASPTQLDATLTEVTDRNPTSKLEQYSVLFQGPREPILSQRIYGIEHPTMGKFELFLVPIGADDSGVTYESVFSRVLE